MNGDAAFRRHGDVIGTLPKRREQVNDIFACCGNLLILAINAQSILLLQRCANPLRRPKISSCTYAWLRGKLALVTVAAGPVSAAP